MPHSGAPSMFTENLKLGIPFSGSPLHFNKQYKRGDVAFCCTTTSPVSWDPVVSKNHNVSHCDILLSLDLKFKEQEGAGPTISSLYKRERDT
jgi:hypothetical protein